MLLPRIILAVVPKSAAANGVDDDEEYEEDDVDYGHLLPVTLYVIEHPSLARLAVIAQHARVVSPSHSGLVWVELPVFVQLVEVTYVKLHVSAGCKLTTT